MTRVYLLAFAALAAMAPGLADPYVMPKLAAVAAAALWVLLQPGEHESYVEAPAWAAMVLWAACAALSRDRSYSLVGTYLSPFDGLLAAGTCLAALCAAGRTGAGAAAAAEAVAAASLPVSIYAMAQEIVGNADPLLPSPMPPGRVVASLGSPVYLGACLALATVCAAHACRRRPILGSVAIGMALPALWFTGTRGAFLAAAAGAAAYLPGRLRLAGLLAAPALLLHPRASALAADAARLEVWRAALAIFRESPWHGSGPGTFGMVFRAHISPAFVAHHGSALVSQSHAHNELLHVLAVGGLLGLAAYALVAGAAALAAASQEDPADRRFLWSLLAAYAVASAFNPMPTSAAVVMAAVFGAASGLPAGAPARLPRAALALGCACLAGRLCLADLYYARGVRAGADVFAAAAAYNRAAQLNPWEVQFTARQLDGLLLLLAQAPPPGRRALAEASLSLAAGALGRHPQDPSAHEIMGRSILVAAALGSPQDPRRAMAYYKRAQELAPTFPTIMVRRRGLAQVLRDREEFMRADRELAALRRLEGRGT